MQLHLSLLYRPPLLTSLAESAVLAGAATLFSLMMLACSTSFPSPGPSKGVVGAVASSLFAARRFASLGRSRPAPDLPDICTVASTNLTKFSTRSLRIRRSSSAEVCEIFSARAAKQRNVGKRRYLCGAGVLMNSLAKFRNDVQIWTATGPSCLSMYASRKAKRIVSWLIDGVKRQLVCRLAGATPEQ